MRRPEFADACTGTQRQRRVGERDIARLIMGLVRLFLALVVAISVAFPAASQDWSYGNGFYAACKDAVVPPAKSPEWAGIACLSYVKGLHDMAGFMWSSGRIRPEVCPPSGRCSNGGVRTPGPLGAKSRECF